MPDTQAVPDYLAEIEAMDYQQMLTTWMTGAPYLVEGSEEQQAFDLRFQKLRAETQPQESTSSSAERSKKHGRKKGKRRG